MELNLEIWSVVIGLMELGCAMTWNHNEQFVEGDFPYYPYSNKISAYADTDGLTDYRIRSNEFSGCKTAQNRRKFQETRKSLYAFNKDSNTLIDASKLDADEPENDESAQPENLLSSRKESHNSVDETLSSDLENLNSPEHEVKPAESVQSAEPGPGHPYPAEAEHSDLNESNEPKSVERKLKSAVPKTSATAELETPHAAVAEKPDLLGGSKKRKGETELHSRHHKTGMKNEKFAIPRLTMFEDKRHRRNSPLESNLAWSRTLDESNSRDLWAHGISRVTSTSGPKRKFARENKPNEKSRKLTLVAPYETNFTGGVIHSVNPSSWLAKEIERFIRRKDHRWLDFMKNTGMDVKKYSGVVSATKQKSEKTNAKKSCFNCLHSSSAPTSLDDMTKLKTDLLIDRIDSLLADLNQFRSSVKNGWSDINSIKKSRDTETSQKLINDDVVERRKHRLRRGIRFSRLSALKRQPARSAATSLVENDLRDLRKNVVLYQNRLPEEEMQAMKDMKLHIKVYVEKEKNDGKKDHHTSGSDMDYYESYPQQIHCK